MEIVQSKIIKKIVAVTILMMMLFSIATPVFATANNSGAEATNPIANILNMIVELIKNFIESIFGGGGSDLTLNKSSATLTVGETLQLTAKVDGNKVNATFESNSSAAVVDKNGKITANAEGSAVITATYNRETAKCNVTVNKAAKKTYTEGSYNSERYKEFKQNRTSWESKAKKVYNALIEAGATKAGAAGVIGNITQECRWNIHLVNDSNHCGMVQWSTERFGKMKNYLGKNKNAKIKDISIEEQTKFMIYELKNSYSGVWTTLTTTNDVIAASDKFQDKYEVCSSGRSNRREFSIDWYNYLNGYTKY